MLTEIFAVDPIFQATQDIAFNEKIIASRESTVKACEDELMTLKEVEARTWCACFSQLESPLHSDNPILTIRTC